MATAKKPTPRSTSKSKKAPVSRVVKPLPAKRVTTKSKPNRQVSSRPSKITASTAVRGRFLAKIVLVAAALVAISLGIMTYNDHRDVKVSVAPGQGVMFLSAVGNAMKAGENLQVALYETSGKEPVNALQSAVSYPSDRMQVESVTTSEYFPQEAATDTATPGLIRIARSIRSQSAPLTGTKLVATVTFRITKDDSSAARLSIIQGRSLLVRSTDNSNILSTEPAKIEVK